jgi:hypothetical protein
MKKKANTTSATKMFQQINRELKAEIRQLKEDLKCARETIAHYEEQTAKALPIVLHNINETQETKATTDSAKFFKQFVLCESDKESRLLRRYQHARDTNVKLFGPAGYFPVTITAPQPLQPAQG